MEFSNCLVCSKPSHGIHFNAETCRACAAFFRRAVLKNYLDLECRKGHGRCERRLEACKKCRLEKCYKVGMSERKLQYSRDLISSAQKQVIYIIGRPTFIMSSLLNPSDRSFIDFTHLINKASNILESESKLYVGMNTLNQLTYALKASKKSVKLCKRIGKHDILKMWEINFLKVAEWFTHCDKFQELPLSMRVEFLKIVWFTWTCLQNFALTANRKLATDGKDELSVFVDGYLINEETLDIDVSWFTKNRKEHFFGPVQRFKRSLLIDSLMNLQPTAQEITYMLAIFSFRHAAKLLKGDFELLSENMIEILGDEIHNYYINEMNLTHYAFRISKMMNIVNNLERHLYEEMEKIKLARLFDTIIVDFSHPELFYGKE